MTIAIVSAALVVPPGHPAVVDDAAVRTARTDEAAAGTDFLSLLLALPAMATSTPAPPAREAIEDSPQLVPEAGTAAATVGMLMLSQQLPPTPYSSAPAASNGERIAGPRPAAGEALGTLLPTGSGRVATEFAPTTTDSRQLPAAAAADAGFRPASFAVPDLAAMPREQVVAEQAEPLAPTLPSHATAAVAGNAATPANAATHTLQTPLRDPAWASEFGQKLVWFANQEKQVAQITVHPPQLGVIEITLNLDRDGATAHFASANAEVRGAIEAAMPRLREMFASAGIDMGQLSVGSQSLGQQPQGQRDSSPATHRLPDPAILGADPSAGMLVQPSAARHGQAMIDVFA
ncbi:MAG TPA: flagellar hook-length control protein FliK [Candidatus Accumulibacter phosphatis]|nr:MAG: Flagellar hook-length control protein [Candidatus Accumulibacter sp. SK-11]HCN68038.1 hypothetical protein [Accumulibacter sp.]HCV12296.1 hypothetical protein [Accumulibacter sp.]HRL78589.1 flagellar hook-length control protein FliK [Candidatus Accumulibacter phosphatis]HRQ96170.1 flagellar hook-length control protein FliK [Candidatus Accumulibacter phosphatis]